MCAEQLVRIGFQLQLDALPDGNHAGVVRTQEQPRLQAALRGINRHQNIACGDVFADAHRKARNDAAARRRDFQGGLQLTRRDLPQQGLASPPGVALHPGQHVPVLYELLLDPEALVLQRQHPLLSRNLHCSR